MVQPVLLSMLSLVVFAIAALPAFSAVPASRDIVSLGGSPPADAFPLGLCQGDCDNDSECGAGLYCFQRGKNEAIPGCNGGLADNSRTDYCTDGAAPSSAPSNAPSFVNVPSNVPTGLLEQPSLNPILDFPSKSPSFRPSKLPSFAPSQGPSNAPSGFPSKSSPSFANVPSNVPTGLIEQPSMNPTLDFPSKSPSFRPSQLPSFAPSQGPSNAPSGFPSKSSSPTAASPGTPEPTPSSPSQSPSLRPSSTPTLKPRQIYAYQGRPPMDAFPLDLCQGDCKDHSECGAGLYCFQRDPNEAIPGCNVGLADSSRTDYCTDIPPPWPAPTQAPTMSPVQTSEAPTVTPDTVPSAIPSSNPTPTPGHIFAYPGGPPSSAYPLGQCQGDCLWHEDCADGMFCFQRDAYEAVPGCMGGETDGTPTDYCTYIAPVVAPVEPPTANNFRIKMYWDDYYWQEEDFDRVWCMQCKNGCQQGEVMFLHYCAWDSARFDFVDISADQVQIQVVDTDLCLERAGTGTSLEICDSSKTLQHWKATEGSFDGDFFEFSQNFDGEDYCVTTHHHPKYGEIIELFTCDVARFDTTSYWTKY